MQLTASAPVTAAARPAKAWATLQARAALRGLSLIRTDPADGRIRLFLGDGQGAVRELFTVDDLEALALHVGAPLLA